MTSYCRNIWLPRGYDTATVIVAVNGLNDAPIAVDDVYTTTENISLTAIVPRVLDNDADADGSLNPLQHGRQGGQTRSVISAPCGLGVTPVILLVHHTVETQRAIPV